MAQGTSNTTNGNNIGIVQKPTPQGVLVGVGGTMEFSKFNIKSNFGYTINDLIETDINNFGYKITSTKGSNSEEINLTVDDFIDIQNSNILFEIIGDRVYINGNIIFKSIIYQTNLCGNNTYSSQDLIISFDNENDLFVGGMGYKKMAFKDNVNSNSSSACVIDNILFQSRVNGNIINKFLLFKIKSDKNFLYPIRKQNVYVSYNKIDIFNTDAITTGIEQPVSIYKNSNIGLLINENGEFYITGKNLKNYDYCPIPKILNFSLSYRIKNDFDNTQYNNFIKE